MKNDKTLLIRNLTDFVQERYEEALSQMGVFRGRARFGAIAEIKHFLDEQIYHFGMGHHPYGDSKVISTNQNEE